jgi:Domain of Unknown Function (DUF1259)
MMDTGKVKRREVLRGAAVAGLVGAAGLWPGRAAEARSARRAGAGVTLSADEMAAIDQALGKKGTVVQDEAIYMVPLPRNDLKIAIQGDPVPIPFGFGGWVAFKKTPVGGTIFMSDTVLLQEEVNRVISAAQANSIEVTAIHNHFFFEEPRIFYMHLHGHGETATLARAYAEAIRPAPLFPGNQPPPSPPGSGPSAAGPGAAERFDTARLAQIAGHEGTANGPVYKITVGRLDLRVMAMGTEITTAMGLNSWAAFAGDRNKARVAGDIAMLEPEVNPVIAALRKNNLAVVAVHQHMLGEQPRIIFLHYYGTGPAETLASGFRAALDELGKHGKTMQMGRRSMRMGG